MRERVEIDPEEMWQNLKGRGQRMANFGIAGIITTRIKGGEFIPIDHPDIYLGETFDVDPRGIARADKMEFARYPDPLL